MATAGTTLTSVGVRPARESAEISLLPLRRGRKGGKRQRTLVESPPTLSLIAFHRRVSNAGVGLRMRRSTLSLQTGSNEVAAEEKRGENLREREERREMGETNRG